MKTVPKKLNTGWENSPVKHSFSVAPWHRKSALVVRKVTETHFNTLKQLDTAGQILTIIMVGPT